MLSDTKGWKFAEKIGLESGRQYFLRVWKWPTLFCEGWKVADIFFWGLECDQHYFLYSGQLPTVMFQKA